MKRLPNATQRVVIALVIGIVAIPISSTALFLGSQMKKSANDERQIRAERILSNAEERAKARKLFRALEEYKQGTSVRDEVTKPSAGDEPAGTEGPSAISSASTEDLTVSERELLRKYVRANSCPDSLKLSPIAGFYELCLAIVGAKVSNTLPTGYMNHEEYIRRTLGHASATTFSPFKLRMQMLQEALTGSKRDAGELPGRPINCAKSADCR